MTTVENMLPVGNFTENGTGTVESGPENELGYDVAPLKMANKVLLTSLVFLIMLAMGATVDWQDMWSKVRRPYGIVVGLLCQFLVNPLLAFGLAHALSLGAAHAIGVMVISTSPGGTTSNIFTYWTDGDVPLSICMTTASTIVAFGMMPLNLYIYTRSWTDSASVVPFDRIALALLFTVLPVAVGMLIRWKLPKLANIVTKVGSVAGLAVIVVTQIIQSFITPGMYRTSWQIYVAALALPWIGFIAGYSTASVFRLTHQHRRTVSLETGCQNVGLCLGLISLTFPDENLGEYILFPLLYGTSIISNCLIATLLYKVFKRLINSDKAEIAGHSDEKKAEGAVSMEKVSKH